MKTIFTTLFILHSIYSIAGENPGKNKFTNSSAKSVNCAPATAIIDLDINNVRAGLLNAGDLWWDLNNAQYEVPAGSGKHSMFAGSVWIGGIDQGGQINVAAMTYRQTGSDFWSGAVDTPSVSITQTQCSFYDRFWKVNRQEVQDFINNGITTPDIISWPGNGNPTYNEGHYLAPFYDANADGIYNYLDGDYPGFNFNPGFPTVPGTPVSLCDNYLFGDQSIWWVINDVGNIKTETGSAPIGLEIRCQAFAYSSSLPSIDNATFYQFQVINRSSSTFTNTYFGMWVDPDLGNATDDFVGCEVAEGLGYCYNGDIDDDTPAGYGIDPPAVGVDFLKGPVADMMDNIDNDRDGCLDCTFVDSSGTILVIPESILPETISMSKFVYYNNMNGTPTGNPNGFTDFYNYLQGIWLDNQPLTYGDDGRNPNNPVCNFMYPGTSDPAFPTNWTEITAGNIPQDRRFLQSAGSFTMQPGEVNYITSAVLWARQIGGGPLGSLNLLIQYDSQIQQLFSQCFRLAGVGITENDLYENVKIYPNPATDFIGIDINLPAGSDPLIEIFNANGELVISEQIKNSNHHRIETKNLAAGNYYCRISVNGLVQKYSKVAIIKP